MLAVSVDTIEESRSLAERLGLDFPILSDAGERAIRSWGLIHENAKPGGGSMARPAIFLVEPDGRISWRELTDDYRVRPRPEELLQVLEGNGR